MYIKLMRLFSLPYQSNHVSGNLRKRDFASKTNTGGFAQVYSNIFFSTLPYNKYIAEVKSLKRYLVSLPIVLLLSYLFYNLASSSNVIAMGKEDGLFEWLTAIFYFMCFLLLLLTFKKNRNVFLLSLALVMFFGAGEEISWGQRLLGFSTPAGINQMNVQHEFNIHNLVAFNGKYMNGEVKQGLARFLEMDLLFKIFTLVFGIVLPFFVYHFKFIAKLCLQLKVPIPPISIGIFFAISWFCLKLSLAKIPVGANTEQYWRVFMAGPEIAEFIGSYVLFIICCYFYNNRSRDIMGRDYKQLVQSSRIDKS